MKILAISSGGGHWVQLLRLRPAFEGHEVIYATVHASSVADVEGHAFYSFSDASRKNPSSFLLVFFQMLYIMLKVRPQLLVTTGSAPVLFCLIFSRLTMTRTLWIDSIANCEVMSTSGQKARKLADRCVSQWPDVAKAAGVECWGQVL